MTNIEEDNTPELEGEVQIPDARQKIYGSVKELGEWLALTNPKMCKVEPTQDGRHLVMWRSE